MSLMTPFTVILPIPSVMNGIITGMTGIEIETGIGSGTGSVNGNETGNESGNGTGSGVREYLRLPPQVPGLTVRAGDLAAAEAASLPAHLPLPDPAVRVRDSAAAAAVAVAPAEKNKHKEKPKRIHALWLFK